MYRQADLIVSQQAEPGSSPLRSEPPAATTARVLASLAEMLSQSDTKKRLRSAPEPGSVALKGSRGPLQI